MPFKQNLMQGIETQFIDLTAHTTHTYVHTHKHIHTHLTSFPCPIPFPSHLATLESRPKKNQKISYSGLFLFMSKVHGEQPAMPSGRGIRGREGKGYAVEFGEVRGWKVISGWAWERCNASTQLERHFKRLKNCTHASTIRIMQPKGLSEKGAGKGVEDRGGEGTISRLAFGQRASRLKVTATTSRRICVWTTTTREAAAASI